MTLSIALRPADASSAAAAPLPVLYATETGRAEGVAYDVAAAAAGVGIDARPVNMADADPSELAGIDHALLVVSTYRDGEAPNHADSWYAALTADDMPKLDGLRFAVLALGNPAFPDFCGFGRKVDARMESLGATRLAELTMCGRDPTQQAAAWADAILTRLAMRDRMGESI